MKATETPIIFLNMINTAKIWIQNSIKKCSIKLFAKVLAGVFLVYLLLSYFAVNPIAKKLVPWVAEKSFASVASVERVAFDPFRLQTTVHGLQLANQEGEQLASLKKMVVDFELNGMFDLAWKFKKIELVEPNVNLTIAQGGQMNWDGFLNKLNENATPPSDSDTIPRLIIGQIKVSQGKAHYADDSRPEPISTTLTPLGFQLKGFSTLPKDRGNYFISAAFADSGGTFKWKGNMGVNPVASKGVFALHGVQIADMLQLVEGLKLPIEVNSGRLQTNFNYDFSMPKKQAKVALNNIEFSLQEVAGAMVDGGSLSFNQVSLSAAKLDFVNSKQPTLQIKEIELKLADFGLQQGGKLDIVLQESRASLPGLDMLMADKPQLAFSDLGLQFTGIQVKKDQQLTVAIPTVDVNAVSFDLSENQANIQEVVVSAVRLSKVDAIDKPIATLEKATMAEGVVALDTQQVNVAAVLFTGLKTSVIKRADQSVNWLELLNTSPAQPSKVKVVAKKPATVAEADKDEASKVANSTWTLALNKIGLEGANVHIEDASVPTPVVMDIVKGNIEVQDASLDMTKPLPVKVAFQIKQGGRFSTKGKLWPTPFKTDLGLRLTGLSLKPLAPYVNQFALLKLNSGSLGVSGKLRVKQQKQLALNFNGGFDVKKLALVEEENDAPFLSWDAMKGEGMQFSLGPDKLHLKTLALVQPSGKFIINADKSMNVQRILRSEQSAEPEAEPFAESAVKEVKADDVVARSGSLIQPMPALKPSKAVEKPVKTVASPSASADSSKQAFPVMVDRVLLKDAKLEFADLSLITPFGTNIHSLNGVVNGLATQVDKVAQVELDGKVDEYGSARIRGELQPFLATEFTDITLAFTNLDMSKLTPYSGKFAGRRIDSGKLSVDLGYKIKQQQLVGENKFVVNKLRLGEKVESDDAADLPLDLAIAILEDSDGVIDLDLPISGSLDDPEFSYSSIVWKAFRNILTKIVTAPFRALGKIFGSGEEAFDGVAFEPGMIEIAPPELEKIVQVSTALSKRQGLALGIIPSYNTALDTVAIKQSAYRRQVAEEMGIELDEGLKPGPVDLANESAQDAVDSLHNKLTKKGLFKRMVSKFEEPEEGHYEKAQAALIASVEVTEDDLKTLAAARAQAIYDAFMQNGIAEERLSLLETADAKASDQVIKVALTLDTKKAVLPVADMPESEAAETLEPDVVAPEAADAAAS